uniref:Geminin n=1 Tax=Heterorhabditis bacteriophora TaxID=37862 RepID=A0A1I7WUX8_HETBA
MTMHGIFRHHTSELYRKSSTQSDSFTVYEEPDCGKKNCERHDIAVQTESTDVSITLNDSLPEDCLPDLAFWRSVAVLRAAQLDQLRDENTKMEEQISLHIRKTIEINDKYEQLYAQLAEIISNETDDVFEER